MIPDSMASITITETGYTVPPLVLLARLAATTPEKARIEPTDRSMPPVRITKVIPKDKSPFIDICRKTFMRFLDTRKFGVAMYNAKHSTKNTSTMP